MNDTAHSGIYGPSHFLGESESVWFKLMPLLKEAGDPMPMLLRMSRKYGGAIPLKIGDKRTFFLSDVDHFRHVLVSNAANYGKYFDGLRPIFGKSMITIDGALWQKIRQPQQAAFHPNMFEQYLPFLLEALRAKSERWSELAASGDSIEMVEETWTLAADMICRALFDRKMPFNPHFVFGMVKTYTDVMEHRNVRRKVTGGQTDLSDEKASKAMEEWAAVPPKVIAAESVDHREGTLLHMLQAAEADPDFPEFDRQQVIDEMKQYLWAGTETTALTLAWCLYLLSQNPEVAEKIRAEAQAVCGDEEPNWQQAQNLTYTRMVIQETMRIYPPIWGLIRVAKNHDEIDGQEIKPGDTMVLCTYAVHHSEKYWNEPELFRPERFSPDRMKARAKYSYLPFGAGRRSCIGGALSQLENGLALAQLLRRFEPEYVGEVPAPIGPTVTLTPRGGLHFRIRELNRQI